MITRTIRNRLFPRDTSLMPINFSGAREILMGQGCPEAVPMDMLSRHLKQVYENHRQGLTIIARQGGLCVSEICAIMEDRVWKPQTHQECATRLVAHLIDYAHSRTSECREEIAQAEAHIEELRGEIAAITSCFLKSPSEPIPSPKAEHQPPDMDVKFEFAIFCLEDGEPPDPFGSELLHVTPKAGETITLHYLDGRVAYQAVVHEVQGHTLFVKQIRLTPGPSGVPEESSP